MKDIYRQRVDNTIESCMTRIKVVKEMITGERQADPKRASLYLQEINKALEEIQQIISRG